MLRADAAAVNAKPMGNRVAKHVVGNQLKHGSSLLDRTDAWRALLAARRATQKDRRLTGLRFRLVWRASTVPRMRGKWECDAGVLARVPRDCSCPRNCRREAFFDAATGHHPGRQEKASIRQPGNLPFHC
jgi:hypothetical protein